MGTEVEETKMDTAINESLNEENVNENQEGENNDECPGEFEVTPPVKEEVLKPLLKKRELPAGIILTIRQTPNHCYKCTYCDYALLDEVNLLEHIRENGHLQFHTTRDVDTNKLWCCVKLNGGHVPINKKLHFRKSQAVGVPEQSQVMRYLNRLSGPIVGLNYVVEVQMPRIIPSFQCNLCDVACGISAILKHIVSNQHQFRYLKSVDEFALSELRSKFLKRADMNREIAKCCEKLQRERGSGKVEVKYVSNPTPRTSALKGLNLTKRENFTERTSVRLPPEGKRSSDGRQLASKRPKLDDDERPSAGKRQKLDGDESSPRNDNNASSTSKDSTRHNQSFAEQSKGFTGHNQKAGGQGGQSIESAAQQVAEHAIQNDDEAKMLTDLINAVTENLIQYKLGNLPSSVRQLLFKKMNTEGKSMECIMGLSGAADLNALDKLSMNSNRHNVPNTAQRNWGNDSPQQHQHSKIPSLLSGDDFYGERSGNQDFSRSGHNNSRDFRKTPYSRQSGSKMSRRF